MDRLPRCNRYTLRAALGLALAAVCLLQTGCVTRRLTIRSNPPGAMVYIDDYEIGPTPVSVPYTYYGTRKIVLVKDGYETLTVMQRIPAPWYDVFPIDFVTENLIPWEIRDQRTVEYNLTPKLVLPRETVRERGEELRQRTHGSAVVPAGTPMPSPQAPLPPGVLRNETLPPGARPATPLPPPPGAGPAVLPPPPNTNVAPAREAPVTLPPPQ